MRSSSTVIVVLLVGLAPCVVQAAVRDDEADEPHRDAPAVTRDGTFLPMTVAARIGDQRLSTLALAGLDGASGQGPIMSFTVEAAILNRVAIRAGVEYVNLDGGQVGPSVGVRFGILRQEGHGVDLGVSVIYRNRGLPQPHGEPDGELELAASVSRRSGRLGVFGNLVYTQGLDPLERNAQVRLAVLYAIGERANVGLDARWRIDLTDGDEGAREAIPAGYDLLVGPLATLAVGHVMLMAQVGVHAEELRAPTPHLAAGVVGLGGVGTSF